MSLSLSLPPCLVIQKYTNDRMNKLKSFEWEGIWNRQIKRWIRRQQYLDAKLQTKNCYCFYKTNTLSFGPWILINRLGVNPWKWDPKYKFNNSSFPVRVLICASFTYKAEQHQRWMFHFQQLISLINSRVSSILAPFPWNNGAHYIIMCVSDGVPDLSSFHIPPTFRYNARNEGFIRHPRS